MYKRLIILSAIILAALCGLAWLGYHSVQIWARGMEGTRLGEFAAVAEQIRQDVNRKMDEFIAREESRPYTEYQNYYVPDNTVAGQREMPVVRSPLAGTLGQGLAYGQFQIDPSGEIITPNDDIQVVDYSDQDSNLLAQVVSNKLNVRYNLLPALTNVKTGSPAMGTDATENVSLEDQQVYRQIQAIANEGVQKRESKSTAAKGDRGQNLTIESFQNPKQTTQLLSRNRVFVEQDFLSNADNTLQQQDMDQSVQRGVQPSRPPGLLAGGQAALENSSQSRQSQSAVNQANDYDVEALSEPAEEAQPQAKTAEDEFDMVQVRIEPLVPFKVPCKKGEKSVFGGQIFMLRHVQIEDKHFVQGFQLNEKELIGEVEESARRFMRQGMNYELARQVNGTSAYTAILDFGFGDLILNLIEIDPSRIARKINGMRTWYFSIITVVLLAVTLALTSLWHNARAQLRLARKKDDFISAVSHELRTPLTSIRMYSEMLEKNWVRSKDKVAEYYKNMRQESERLSRLIENVLDFSRIQRGKKSYDFSLGDVNKYVRDVVEMMRPYAAQNGFTIQTQLGEIQPTAFDGDAVTQIVVNLLDNAVKYARDAEDKTVIVRTRGDREFITIEVEDHGPGVPHRQRKKIFEEFYRIGAEATRETTGTGLGLALVKRFAQAHNGFVEIISARPKGAIFRVALAARM
jgi:signal transduction histidine kinase